MDYTFNGKLTLEDFVQYNTHYMLNLSKKILFFIIFGILCYIAYILLSHDRISFIKDILPVFVFCLIFAFIIKRPKIFYKKYFFSNKIAQEEYNFVINENEMHIKTESSSAILTKEKIHKILFDKDSIYIYTNMQAAIIIKSRYLDNPDEFNGLVNLIKNNYTPPSKAKRHSRNSA